MMVAPPTMGSQLVEVISLCKQPNADRTELAKRIKDFQEHSIHAVLGNNWIIHKDLLILKGGESSYLIQQSLAAKHSIKVITRLPADKFTAAYVTINKHQVLLQQQLSRVQCESQMKIQALKAGLDRSMRLIETGKQNVLAGNQKMEAGKKQMEEGLNLKQQGAENEQLAKQMAQLSLGMFQTGVEELKAAEKKVATGKAMVAEADKKLAALDEEEARLLAELAALDN